MTSTKNAPKRRRAKSQPLRAPEKQPFLEHVHELRRRLFYVIASITLFSCAAYGVQHSIVGALLKPAKHQEFIYTTPGGGLDFLFRLCMYVGIICSIPVIVYQLLRYLEPLLKMNTRKAVAVGSIASGILAGMGMAFGYFIGLPAAMHFLMNQFLTPQIQPLLTIQSYMSFVMVYMLGSALLLQVPLILLIINRIKPLKPQKLLSLKYERWVILIGFVGGALMNPNPNLMAQMIVVIPMILAYQIGVLLIWITNRNRPSQEQLAELRTKDEELRESRLHTAHHAKQIKPVLAVIPVQPHPAAVSASSVQARPAVSVRPSQVIPKRGISNDMIKPKTAKQMHAKAIVHKKVHTATQAPQSTPQKQASSTPVRQTGQRRYISDFAPRRSDYNSLAPVQRPGRANA